MKKALIVASTAGFVKAFLMHDMELLKKKGFEVHCATNANGMIMFDPETFFLENNIVFHQIDFSTSSPFSKATITAAEQLKKVLKDNVFSFVHCHTPIVGAIVRFLCKSKRKHGCKVVYTTHGLAYPKGSDLKSKIIYGSTEAICSRWCDAIITINWEDYNTVKKYWCKHVYHINGVGVDTSKYHAVEINRDAYRASIGVSPDKTMVLSVGELSKRKNQQIIIRALAQLNKEQYVFIICGKGMSGKGTYDELVRLSDELGVSTKLLGFRRDIPEITNCADIVVMPSLREGLGLAGVQALASGVPVIGSRVQGIMDYVVDGKTGFLCNPNSSIDFANRIKELTDPEERTKMRKDCIEKAEEFSIVVSYSQMEKIYQEVLDN